MGLVHTEARGQQATGFSFDISPFFRIVFACVPVWGYLHVTTGARRGHKRSLDLLELKLQGVVSLPTGG